MTRRPVLTVRQLCLCALFAALTAIASQIQIPLPMIPINLALLAVHLCGALLGKRLGGLATGTYAVLGLCGLPVFAGFKGGPGVLFGPTGGYILGYLLCAFVVGLCREKWGLNYLKLCLGMILGAASCYAFGTVWFMLLTGNSLWVSLGYCVFPFLIGDALKIALAAFLTQRLAAPFRRAAGA